MRRLTALILAIILAPGQLAAERRLALVIGNDAYAEVTPLRKARNDAQSVADKLAVASGFEVMVVLDADRRQMNREIARFVGRLEPGDTALVFYAGHGVEIDGQNYLLPVDIPAAGNADLVTSEAIELPQLLDRIRGSGARLTLAIIDACRDNPFAQVGKRSLGGRRGLALMSAPEGAFVVFSAGAGQAALDSLGDDDPHPNSVFTRSLLPMIGDPGRSIRDLAVDLRRQVHRTAGTVNHVQTPAYYDELLGDFRFVESPVPASFADTADHGRETDSIRADFSQANSIGTKDAWSMFLEEHGGRTDEFLVKLAHTRMAALTGGPSAGARGRAKEQFSLPPDPVAAIAQCDRVAASPLDGERPPGADGVPWNKLRGMNAVRICGAALTAAPDNARIMFQLARAHQKAGQHARAIPYYRQAADKGYLAAITGLGVLHQNGVGTTRDAHRASQLFRQAADAGDAHALALLANLYRRGQGVERDPDRAVYLFSRAADLGSPSGAVGLGSMYLQGQGVRKDPGRAIELFQQAAGQGNPRAQVSLGQMYQHGNGVKADHALAVEYYERAAAQGHPGGQVSLGNMYLRGLGVRKDPGRALELFQLAAGQGNPRAMLSLAEMYYGGVGVTRNTERAMGLYRKAVGKGDSKAMNDLAMLLAAEPVHGAAAAEIADLLVGSARKGNRKAKTNLMRANSRLPVEVRREVQRILRNAGLYRGSLDGQLGAKSRQALERYLES